MNSFSDFISSKLEFLQYSSSKFLKRFLNDASNSKTGWNSYCVQVDIDSDLLIIIKGRLPEPPFALQTPVCFGFFCGIFSGTPRLCCREPTQPCVLLCIFCVVTVKDIYCRHIQYHKISLQKDLNAVSEQNASLFHCVLTHVTSVES